MSARICTFLLLLTSACQLDPKTIGDPTGDSGDSGEGTDSASSEPMSTSQGSATTSVGTSESDTTPATTSVGTSESDTTPATTSVGTSETGSTSVGTSETGGPPPVDCSDGPQDFPAFPKACQTADDCAIGYHAIDCCGSPIAVGIQAADEQSFMEAENMCLLQYPLCDCIPQPPLAEDGNQLGEGQEVAVECKDMLCTTFIADPCKDVELPACPGECPPEQFPADCGAPCQDEGAACGNNIGDGMVCTGGTWGCVVHPPLGEGCNLVCK